MIGLNGRRRQGVWGDYVPPGLPGRCDSIRKEIAIAKE